jgi:hypothetical protein
MIELTAASGVTLTWYTIILAAKSATFTDTAADAATNAAKVDVVVAVVAVSGIIIATVVE